MHTRYFSHVHSPLPPAPPGFTPFHTHPRPTLFFYKNPPSQISSDHICMYMKTPTGELPTCEGQQLLERPNCILFTYTLIISYIYIMYFDNGKSLFLRNNLYYVNYTLFLMCICVYTHAYVCRWMHVQVSVCMCMQRPEFNFGCHSSGSSTLFLLRQSFIDLEGTK